MPFCLLSFLHVLFLVQRVERERPGIRGYCALACTENSMTCVPLMLHCNMGLYIGGALTFTSTDLYIKFLNKLTIAMHSDTRGHSCN